MRTRSTPNKQHASTAEDRSIFGGDTIRNLLRRVSNLEAGFQRLDARVEAREQLTHGADASAAGLKSAVDALAAASSAFARRRNFEPEVVGRALDELWPDGFVPRGGADGEALCALARSLVMASCRRNGGHF
jgi:hypothetical protein